MQTKAVLPESVAQSDCPWGGLVGAGVLPLQGREHRGVGSTRTLSELWLLIGGGCEAAALTNPKISLCPETAPAHFNMGKHSPRAEQLWGPRPLEGRASWRAPRVLPVGEPGWHRRRRAKKKPWPHGLAAGQMGLASASLRLQAARRRAGRAGTLRSPPADPSRQQRALSDGAGPRGGGAESQPARKRAGGNPGAQCAWSRHQGLCRPGAQVRPGCRGRRDGGL